MMKHIIVIVMFTCASAIAHAQVNLVKNGGFEQYRFCPHYLDEIGFCNYWSGLDTNWVYGDSSKLTYTLCLPEYCNTCSKSAIKYANIPDGGFYFQYPRSGAGFAQVRMLDDTSINHDSSDYRDYLQGRLSKTLTSGKNYCVTFYVNLAEVSSNAIDKIGAYLDNGGIDNTDSAHCPQTKVSYTPQIVTPVIVDDTMGWTKVQGNFTASGNERFITIGNFSDFAHTNKIYIYYSAAGYGFTWYLIDDVSVMASDAIADAGSDRAGAVGDSIHIGTNEEGMPCTWYLAGDTTHPVGYGGGIKVRPMATGTYHYVVMLDLCGHITWDTMTLYVWPAGINNGSMTQWLNCSMYPSPATNVLHIDGAEGCEVGIYNPVGQLVYSVLVSKKEEVINVEQLPRGSYYVVVTDRVTGYRAVRQVMKK